MQEVLAQDAKRRRPCLTGGEQSCAVAQADSAQNLLDVIELLLFEVAIAFEPANDIRLRNRAVRARSVSTTV